MVTLKEREPQASPRPQLWRVTDRATFSTMRRAGRRARRGGVSVAWLAPEPSAATTPPRVAFAVGKATGGAVVRNRVRRRLRAALSEIQRDGRLPAGTYLLSARAEAARSPWPQLVASTAEAVAEATKAGSA